MVPERASSDRHPWLRATVRLLGLTTGIALGRSLAPWCSPPELPHDAEIPALADSLSQVQLVDYRPEIPDYQRQHFGPGWAARGGGCTTRQAVIAAQFSDVRAGPSNCRLVGGWGTDPYSGEELSVAADAIEVDHIFPLSAAWDLGAGGWDGVSRAQFANDAVNLVATSREENRDKLDQLPSQWLPSDPSARCWYSRRVAFVAARWNLALPIDDARAMRRACRRDAVASAITLPVRLLFDDSSHSR